MVLAAGPSNRFRRPACSRTACRGGATDPCRDAANPHPMVGGTAILHGARRGGRSGAGRLDLFEGVLDQRGVVFFDQIALNQLRGDPE